MDDRRLIDTARLDRIEDKLDKLTDYISAVARMDERVIVLENNCKEIKDKLDKNDTKTEVTKAKVDGFVRFFWVLISASLTFSGAALLLILKVLIFGVA